MPTPTRAVSPGGSPASRQVLDVVLGQPGVQALEQRLRLPGAHLAEGRQGLDRDAHVHHLALVARVGGAVFDVVGDGLDELAHVAAQDAQLLHHALVGHEGALAQRDPAVVRSVCTAPTRCSSSSTARAGTSPPCSRTSSAKPSGPSMRQGRGAPSAPAKRAFAHPGAEHAGRAVVVRAGGVRAARGLGQQHVDVLARQPGEDGSARDRGLAARQREVLHRGLDVDALGDRLEGAVGERVLQHQPHERTQQLGERQAHG